MLRKALDRTGWRRLGAAATFWHGIGRHVQRPTGAFRTANRDEINICNSQSPSTDPAGREQINLIKRKIHIVLLGKSAVQMLSIAMACHSIIV